MNGKHIKTALQRWALTAALVLVSAFIYAQQTETQQVIADIIEDLTSQAESEQDYSELTEFLQVLAENPININTITREQLVEMSFLNDFQISSLLDYRDSLGTIYTIYELLGVPGYGIVDLQRLQPFFVFKNVEVFNPQSMLHGRSQLAVRFRTAIETPVGYTDNYTGTKYLGDKNSYFARYSYRGGRNLEVGLVAEKDPGEPCFDGTFKTGVDYLSGYINIKDYKWLKNLVLGSFKAGFGQGLTFWNGLSFGKSGNTLGVGKHAAGVSPHASAYESQYLQGVGATLGFNNFEATIFGSYRNIDAGISDTLQSGELAYSSLPETGYHRTPGEIANRGALAEAVFGANTRYNFKNARVGLTFVHQQIDGMSNKEQAIYELNLRPSIKNVLGADFNMNNKQHNIFGEVAVDADSGALAVVAGGLFRINALVQVSLLGRSYSKHFNSRYTAGFAEGGTSNENGFYAGLSMLPASGWKLSAYIDLFQFPWLRYGVNAPSHGREFMLLSEHSFGRNTTAHLRYRFKQKEANMSGSQSLTTPVIMQTTQSVRLQLNYKPSTNISLKTSLNATSFDTDSMSAETGYLITQDVGYKFSKQPISLNFRFAIFDTPSYSSRIYSYESDMLYSFSVPAYYSKGSRYFFLINYSPVDWLEIWLRYSQSYFSQMNQIGSGADLVNGNTRSEFKAMIRLRF